MTDPDPDVMSKAMTRYDKAMQDFDKAGGYAAQSGGLVLHGRLARPAGGHGAAARHALRWPAPHRAGAHPVLNADTLIISTSRPTTLDADSIEWLRGYLKKYEARLLVISSTELLDEVVNKVWHLDAQLGQIDMYSLGWKAYLHQRGGRGAAANAKWPKKADRPHEARHSTARQGHKAAWRRRI